MNNGYDNFENKDKETVENGAPETFEPVVSTPEVSQPETVQSQPEETASQYEAAQPQPEQTTAEPEKNEESPRGEYHYTGSQMGGYGRERFSAGQPPYTGGSYTYRGPYGNDGRASFGYRGNEENDPYADRSKGDAGDKDRNEAPYGAQGAWGQYNPYGEVYPSYNGKKQKKKQKNKQKRGIGPGLLAIVCCATVLVSAAAGFAGAAVYSRHMNNGNNVPASGGDGTTVIDRVVESVETSTGDKGVYTEIAAAVKDSVVEITTEFQVTGFFQYVSEGAGSGVIISDDGYIITNNHVIADTNSGDIADSITVRLTNGNEYKASLIGKDADSDIAIIKIKPDEKLSHAVFGDSDKLVVGEEVLAVGNPLGELGGTVTNGIISALDREMEVDGITMNLLQTNAAVNPGNSGGGLFNMKGELIGVVNAKSSGSGIEGLGFAIPSNDAHKVATELIENGYVTGKVYIGVSFADITDPYTAYRYFKSQATGVYVVELMEGYNDNALKKGDRIVAIDGNEITSFAQIKDILKDHSVGDEIEFTLYRTGKLTTVDVKCYEYKPEGSDSVDFGE